MARKVWIGIGGAGVLLALGAGGYMATTTAGGFDSDRWKALRHSTARENPRAGMIGDLQKQLRLGMTPDEVVGLLGQPDTTEGNRYVYRIGTSAFGVDYEYFVVEFGADGKLVRHSIMRG
jgi:hypothetical protein